VGDRIEVFEEGKAQVFDDSFEHEAWHDGSSTRINLIVDFWHPDLSDAEVKFLSFIQRAKMRTEQQIAKLTDDSYFSVIQRAWRTRPKDNSWWYLERVRREDDSKAAQS
jgi:aspartate beta-hydroxylase